MTNKPKKFLGLLVMKIGWPTSLVYAQTGSCNIYEINAKILIFEPNNSNPNPHLVRKQNASPVPDKKLHTLILSLEWNRILNRAVADEWSDRTKRGIPG